MKSSIFFLNSTLLVASLIAFNTHAMQSPSQHVSKAMYHLGKAGIGTLKAGAQLAQDYPIATGAALLAGTAGATYLYNNGFANCRQSIKDALIATRQLATSSSTVNSLVPGAVIGAGFGLLNYQLDTHGFWPISWILASPVRDLVALHTSADLTNYGIRHDKELISSTAQLADWSTYLLSHHAARTPKGLMRAIKDSFKK